MTSECQHEAWEFSPPQSRRCADCGEWLEDQSLETAMTSELRPAVEVWLDAYEASYYDEVDDDRAAAAVIEADREAVRAEQAAELAKFKALAETLAGALHHRGGPLCPARYYGDAQCTCGVAEALRQYKEACHD